MPLVKDGIALTDPYLRILDDAPIADDVAMIVPADRLLADATELAGRTGKTGVLWPNNRAISELAPLLPRLALVALHFPTFRDGRAYSQARLLRERYNFRGELRATGDVLRDQFLFMQRAGFDAFEVKKYADVAAFSKSAARFRTVYQPAADRRITAKEQRRHDTPSDSRTTQIQSSAPALHNL